MPPLDLKHFLLSAQALSLYRQFFKVIHKIPDSGTRK